MGEFQFRKLPNHCHSLSSSGQIFRSSAGPGKGESGRVVEAVQHSVRHSTVCGIVQRAASMTGRWVGRGQSQHNMGIL